MRIKRLKAAMEETGIPESVLRDAYREKGQDFARKKNPGKRNSPLLFDCDKLEQWWAQKCMEENKAMNRRSDGRH